MSPSAAPVGSAIRQRPVQMITLALIFVGAIFATAEVSVVAITKELGQPNAASLVIGVYALGSFLVGLTLGALNLRIPLHRQLLIAVAILALTSLPLLVAKQLGNAACCRCLRQRHRDLADLYNCLRTD